MHKSYLLIAFALIVLLAGSGGLYWLAPGQPVHTARVERGVIRQFVEEQGKTRLPEVYRITMPFSGRIEPITLVEGDRVAKGQVVAQIVPRDLQLEVDQAQAAVERVEASIEENKDNSVEERARQQAQELVESMAKTAEAARARLTASEKRLEYATRYRQQTEQLYQQRATSQDEFERAQVEEVNQQVQYAQDALIWQATESMRKATELMPKIIDAYINRKVKTRRALEHQRAEAQARLEEVLNRQELGTMRSPVDGVVLARHVTNRRFLAAGTELLTIGQLDRLEIETDVLTVDVGRIHVGDAVEVFGPAVGDESGPGVPGKVRRIFPAGFTKISSLGVEQQRVKVIIGLGQSVLSKLIKEHNLGVDFRVRVRIITDEKAGVLVVPRSALFRAPDGSWQVFAVRGRRARRQDVTVGLMNDQLAEVVDGLAEGDLVVVAPEASLEDGARVSLSD